MLEHVTGADTVRGKVSGWHLALILFFLTSMVESIGMSHVFSFLPVYLQNMGVGRVSMWVGILSALAFLVGLPLVPLWGVWADRYSGKAVIIRSAYVEAVVFVILGLSHTFPGVFVAMALVGFQLGNTGIMLASVRRLVPNGKVGFAVSMFSVSSPVGMALGPLIGGGLVDSGLLNLHGLYVLDAALSFITGTMLFIFYREQPRNLQQHTPANGSAWRMAWQSVHVTFSLRITWALFGVYTVLMMARQMINPYLPIAIEQLRPNLNQITIVIGGMMGLTALVGAVITVVAGKIGDVIGFKRVLAIAFAVNIPFTLMLVFAHHLIPFGLWLTGFSAAVSISGAMIFALLSTHVPESHRSTALNLVYLPLYLGGIIGPAMSSVLSRFGLIGPFAGASIAFAMGVGLIVLTLKPTQSGYSIDTGVNDVAT